MLMNNILGIDTRSMDSKYRVIVPSIFKISKDKKLVLIMKKDYIEVRGFDEVVGELNELKERVKGANSLELIEHYEGLFNVITSCISNTVVQDKSGRILLGEEMAKKYGFSEKVTIEGAFDCFRIWEVNKFKEYQSKNFNDRGRK